MIFNQPLGQTYNSGVTNSQLYQQPLQANINAAQAYQPQQLNYNQQNQPWQYSSTQTIYSQAAQPYQNNNFTQDAYGKQYVNPQFRNDRGMIWVQGEAGAKAYPVAPGNTVMLMDSESDMFFIKSADQNGIPLPLRSFSYKELPAVSSTQNETLDNSISGNSITEINDNTYITRAEFEKRMAELSDMQRSDTNESVIQSTGQQSNARKSNVKHDTTV